MAIGGWGRVVGSAINKVVSQVPKLAQQAPVASVGGQKGKLPSLLAVMAKKKFGRFF